MFRRLRCVLSTQTRESKAEELLSSRLNSDDDAFTGDELSPKLSIFGEMNPIENAQMLSVSAPQTQVAAFHQISSLYSRLLFSFGLFDSADIVYKMTIAGLIDEPVSKTIPRWLVSPIAVSRDRNLLARQLGYEREKGLREVLLQMLDEFDTAISPLQRFLDKTTLNKEIWTSFLRGIVSVGVFQQDTAHQISGVIRACINGELTDGDPSLAIDGDQRDRAGTVGHLLLESSAEFGCPPVTNLALEIFSSYHINCSVNVMRRVQQGNFRAAKRRMDWQLRASGRLKHVAPIWYRDYFPFIRTPDDAAASATAASATNEGSLLGTRNEVEVVGVSKGDDDGLPLAEKNNATGAAVGARNSSVSSLLLDVEELTRRTVSDLQRHKCYSHQNKERASASAAAAHEGAQQQEVASYFAKQRLPTPGTSSPSAALVDYASTTSGDALASAIRRDAALNAALACNSSALRAAHSSSGIAVIQPSNKKLFNIPRHDAMKETDEEEEEEVEEEEVEEGEVTGGQRRRNNQPPAPQDDCSGNTTKEDDRHTRFLAWLEEDSNRRLEQRGRVRRGGTASSVLEKLQKRTALVRMKNQQVGDKIIKKHHKVRKDVSRIALHAKRMSVGVLSPIALRKK